MMDKVVIMQNGIKKKNPFPSLSSSSSYPLKMEGWLATHSLSQIVSFLMQRHLRRKGEGSEAIGRCAVGENHQDMMGDGKNSGLWMVMM